MREIYENEESELDLDEILEFASTMDEDENDFIDGENSDDYLDEDELNEMEELNEDQLFEDESSHEDTMTDEELKVEALKIATNIAKLMSNVTTDDIISIADKVSGFIRNHSIGSEVKEEDKEKDEDDELIDDFPSLEDEKENNEKE